MARVSTHDDLSSALAPCGAVMESIVEDAQAKSACYREVEAVADLSKELYEIADQLAAGPG